MILNRTRLPIPRLRASFSSASLRQGWLIGAVAGVACLHLALAIASVQQKSATFDEVAHVTAGYSYWKHNDYRLHPENGNLPQRWMALPLVLFSDLSFPGLDTDNWRRSDLWQLGDEFFHGAGNDVEHLLLTARCAIAVVSVALCVLVFFWSRSLFGNLGGLIALLICAFSPTVLAHGRLATSDLFTTFFFAAAVWSIWELLHRVSAARLLAGALAVSGLFLCKTSAVLILPMAALMALISLTPRQAISVRLPNGRSYELTTQWSRRACVLAVTVVIGLATYTSVWAAYGFRYTASSDGNHEFYKFRNVETVTQRSGTAGQAVQWLAERRLLPEAYLYGAAFVAAHERRAAFLNGEYTTKGWKHFFPYCLAVKTPLALFGLLALGMIALPLGATRRPGESIHVTGAHRVPSANRPGLFKRRRLFDKLRHTECADDVAAMMTSRPRRGVADEETSSRRALAYHLIPVAIALLILWSVFLGTKLNIGHRHILPTYPFMFVLAGAAARWCRRETRIAAGAIALLLMWLVADSLASYPHYLSYFNQLVPRDQAYRHLVDSSLDWGQDLPSLKQWLDREVPGDEPVFLGYFGTASPASYGITAEPLPLLGMIEKPLELRPGTYCISATCLQAVYGFAPGRWNQQYEACYQELTARVRAKDEPIDARLRQQWDALRARRLAAYLRHREADANAGYSILIYRVTDKELAIALDGPPAELDRLSWDLQRVLEAERERR